MLAACWPSASPPRLHACRQCLRSLSSRSGPKQFAEGDVVLLRDKKRHDSDGILTYALKSGGQVRQTSFAGRPVDHDEIIGKRPRDVIQTKRTSFRLHEPTLEEYVRLSPRIATPIYHDDANAIVGLLDIHVEPPSSENALFPPLEILEAGTGHGAVTLHLARAIHAANPPLPKSQESLQPLSETTEDPSEDATYDSPLADSPSKNTFEAWRKKRRAVVHTVEAKRRNMVHARQIVKHFRRGLYARHVDFHLGDVTQWIEGRLETEPRSQSDSISEVPEPFLSRVFLDLPASEDHLPSVARALQVDGILAVFNPSITQIADCLKVIKESRLPLKLEHVAELRGGQTARPWEIKFFKEEKAVKTSSGALADNVSFKAQLAKANEWNDDVDEAESEPESQSVGAEYLGEADVTQGSSEGLVVDSANSEKWRVVCRPKLINNNVGGFVGIFRKISYDGQRQERPAKVEDEPLVDSQPSI